MIAGSQSRWIKQQYLYYNADGMELNATNDFGAVNADDLVVYINNLTHFTKNTVSSGSTDNAPTLNVDGISAGKNSLDFLTNDELNTSNSDFALFIDWNKKFNFSTKLNTTAPQTNRRILSIGDLATGGSGDEIFFGHSNGELQILINYGGANYKRIETVGAGVNDGNWYKIDFEYAGTDDIGDCKIYVEDILQSTTVIQNTSLSSLSLTLSQIKVMISTYNIQRLIGRLGSILIGKGDLDLTQRARYI